MTPQNVIERCRALFCEGVQAIGVEIAQRIDATDRFVTGVSDDRQLAELSHARVGGHPFEHRVELVERLREHGPRLVQQPLLHVVIPG